MANLTKRSSDWARALAWRNLPQAEADNVALDLESFGPRFDSKVTLLETIKVPNRFFGFEQNPPSYGATKTELFLKRLSRPSVSDKLHQQTIQTLMVCQVGRLPFV